MYDFKKRQEENWGDFGNVQPTPETCRYGAMMAQWAEPIVTEAEHRRDLHLIRNAELLLQHKLMRIYLLARGHRFSMGPMNHTCLWHVYQSYVSRLFLLEEDLMILQFQVIEPAPPPEQTKKHIVIAEVRG